MPFLFAAGGIERKQALVSGTQVKGVARFNRRHFIGDFARIVSATSHRQYGTRASFRLWTLSGVNLFRGEKALTFLIATMGRPV